MTIHPFQTARYNGVPLARHTTQEQPQPVYTSLDALIEDMKASAEETKREIEKRQAIRAHHVKVDHMTNEAIVAFVAKNPGVNTRQIAKHFKAKINVVYARMKTIAKRGAVKVEWVPGETKKVQVFFATGGDLTRTRTVATPILDSLIEYIRTNPGCDTNQIAADLGRTRPSVVASLKRARQIVTIRTERHRNGSHNAAQYWVEAAQ